MMESRSKKYTELIIFLIFLIILMILLISAEKFNRYLMIHNDKSMVLPASELKKEIKNNKRYAVVCLGGGRIDRYKY